MKCIYFSVDVSFNVENTSMPQPEADDSGSTKTISIDFNRFGYVYSEKLFFINLAS